MKYRFQPIPNWDVCSAMREMGFCLPADSARKVVLGNDVSRGTPWRIDRLCTHVILINLPRQPLFHFANCTLAGLHHTGSAVRPPCLPGCALPPGAVMDTCQDQPRGVEPSDQHVRDGHGQGAPLMNFPGESNVPTGKNNPVSPLLAVH